MLLFETRLAFSCIASVSLAVFFLRAASVGLIAIFGRLSAAEDAFTENRLENIIRSLIAICHIIALINA